MLNGYLRLCLDTLDGRRTVANVKYYSPVGRGVALLKANGRISYMQSEKEAYDMESETLIKRLAAQAWPLGPMMTDDTARFHARIENFAELIVRECCKQIREIDAMEIRNHFGIEK